MRNKPHSNKFKRLRAAVKELLPDMPWVTYDIKEHRRVVQIGDKKFEGRSQQLLLGRCQRKFYQTMK